MEQDFEKIIADFESETGFVCAVTNTTASRADAFFGPRICFKSSERAAQFGKQFIELWNDFLLLQE